MDTHCTAESIGHKRLRSIRHSAPNSITELREEASDEVEERNARVLFSSTL